jgi:predicted Abi (CAAX) family protease
LITQFLGIYALIATPLALGSGLTTVGLADLTWSKQLLVALRVLLFPALIEEGFWRVVLLPHKTEAVSQRQRWLMGVPSLVLFVAMHPLNGMTLYTAAASTFTNPVFLCLTTLLGFICIISYWRSGSWWVPTIIHWAIVVAWLLVFNGYAQLHN